jgi:hypothetical protein
MSLLLHLFANRKMKLYFFVVLLLSVGLSTFVAFTFGHRGHFTGDSISNDNLWVGSKNFAINGFFKLHFVPIQTEVFLDPSLPLLPLPAGLTFYTHYPSGGEYVHGFLYKLGMHSRVAHKIFALSVMYLGSLLALQVLFKLFRPWPALLAWSVCILTPSFIFFADSLHAYTWFFLFDWYFLSRVVDLKERFEAKEQIDLSRKAGEFFIIGFVASWFSIDAVAPLLSIGLIPIFFIPKEKRGTYGVILIAAAPLGEIIGFSLHVLKNAAVLGGIREALKDIYIAFLIRSGEHDLIRHLGKIILGLPWFFTVPVIILAIYGWYKKLRQNPEPFWKGAFCATLIGAVSWQIFMKQHATIHDFTLRHAELFIILGFGLFCQYVRPQSSMIVASGAIAFLICHSVLGVLQVEGAALKRPLIHSLISGESASGWACKQSAILSADDLQELKGAQSIVRTMLPNDCTTLSDVSGIKGRLAEAVLYWR